VVLYQNTLGPLGVKEDKLSVGGKKDQLVKKVVQALGISSEEGASSSSSSQSSLEYPKLVLHNILVKLKS
jgi:hypothetical protein